ncbi:MAG: hypothetical protein QOF21_1283 [Actinomycetota bacterium]|jgi:hypothetical protein
MGETRWYRPPVQRLYVVGVTTDHEGLILSARRGTKGGGWSVNVDAELEEAVAAVLKERGESAEPRIPRAESQLSVREMQQRLRSGQSIHHVARAAGVSDEWVARFAIPIQAEQTQVVRQAFEMIFSKQRLGVSAQPLGVSVWWNLQDRSVMLDEEQWESGWSAFLVRDQHWVVRFEYEARKRQQVADWEVDLKTRTLISRNRLATELAFVEAGRRRRAGPPAPVAGGLVTRPQPPINDVPPPPAEAPAAKRAPARKRPAKKRALKKAAPRKATAKRATAKRATAKRATAKKVAPRRTKKATPKKAAARKASPRKAAPRPVPPLVISTPSSTSSSTLRPPALSPRVSSVRVALPSQTQRVLTPPPAPSTSRKRPVDGNGRPVRRERPLRAR